VKDRPIRDSEVVTGTDRRVILGTRSGSIDKGRGGSGLPARLTVLPRCSGSDPISTSRGSSAIVKSSRRLVVLVALVATMMMMLLAAPAWAHVDLTASDPANGDVVETPLQELHLEFSVAAVPAGDGLVLYDASGEVIPTTIEIVSETEVTVSLAEPLDAGPYALTWSMRAGDAHPSTGGVEFAVAAAQSAAIADPPDDALAAADVTGLAAPDDENPVVALEGSLLDSVASEQSTAIGDWLGILARGGTIVAALLGIGSLVFASVVFEGSRREARMIAFWSRRAGLALILAVPIELLSQSLIFSGGGFWSALAPSSLVAAASGSFGTALLLRLLGGTALLMGTRTITTRVAAAHPSAEPSRPSLPVGAPGAVAAVAPPRERLNVAASPVALAGAALIVMSFLFDGHTASVGPALLVRFSAGVHVAAAATWVGGVVMLARILVGRQRSRQPLDAARIVLPFSVVAAVAVVFTGFAGAVLSLLIADSPADLFATPWGRMLLAKLALVGVAGAIGGYNHRVLIPRLSLDADHSVDARNLAATMRVESVILVGAALATGILVGLSA